MKEREKGKKKEKKDWKTSDILEYYVLSPSLKQNVTGNF